MRNIKCKPPSLVVANSYGLGLGGTKMLELGRFHWKIEGKWNHFLAVYLTWDGMKGYE